MPAGTSASLSLCSSPWRNDRGCALHPEALPADVPSPRSSWAIECTSVPRVGVGSRGGGLPRCSDQQAASRSSGWPSVVGLGQLGPRDGVLLVGPPLSLARKRHLETAIPRRPLHGSLLGRPGCVRVVLLLFYPHLRQSLVRNYRGCLYAADLVHRNGCSDHLGRSGRTHLGDAQGVIGERELGSL
jgi:hypothetical protein